MSDERRHWRDGPHAYESGPPVSASRNAPAEIAERLRDGQGYGSFSKAELDALARAFLAQHAELSDLLVEQILTRRERDDAQAQLAAQQPVIDAARDVRRQLEVRMVDDGDIDEWIWELLDPPLSALEDS